MLGITFRLRNCHDVLATAVIFTWCFFTFPDVCCLEIRNLHVPTVVEIGSSQAVTLDCDYVYEENEKNDLVVKWYRDSGPNGNKNSQQVYQWITALSPQDLGILKGRLDINYEASDDPYSKYRALRIIEPSVELTGVYSCHVSSNFNDAYKSQKMIVFSPPKEVWMNFTKPDAESVNITCGAEGSFPQPTIELIMIKGRKQARNKIHDPSLVTSRKSELYDIVVFKVFKDSQLSAETTFECVIAVPDTNFSTRKSVEYYPGNYVGELEADESQSLKASVNRGSAIRSTGEHPVGEAAVHFHTGPVIPMMVLFVFFYYCCL